MTDPAVTREAAHAARRDGRAVAAEEAWVMPELLLIAIPDERRAELQAMADRAGRRAELAFNRAVTP